VDGKTRGTIGGDDIYILLIITYYVYLLMFYMFLWPPYGIEQAIIFLPFDFYLSSFFLSFFLA